MAWFCARCFHPSKLRNTDRYFQQKPQSMNPFNDATQQARTFSAHLGDLAAQAANRPQANFPQTGTSLLPERLAAIVGHFQQRQQKRKQMHKEMLTEEFAAP
jgi:hypothetical protein